MMNTSEVAIRCGEHAFTRLQKLLPQQDRLLPKIYQTEDDQYIIYWDSIYDFGGLAEILYEVIKEVEEIDLLLCTDSGDKTYLIYTPSYPWTPKTEKEKELTEEKLENMFRKYLRIVTDEQLPVDYKSVENFS